MGNKTTTLRITSVTDLEWRLQEATHLKISRIFYDHHLMIGDIKKYTDYEGNECVEFCIFEFSSPIAKTKAHAALCRREVILKKYWHGGWYVAQETGVQKAKDTLQWNISKGRLYWVQKEGYPKSIEDREAAVRRARRPCQNGLLKGTYHALRNNCEHLVTHWLTRNGHSSQSGWRWPWEFRRRIQ